MLLLSTKGKHASSTNKKASIHNGHDVPCCLSTNHTPHLLLLLTPRPLPNPTRRRSRLFILLRLRTTAATTTTPLRTPTTLLLIPPTSSRSRLLRRRLPGRGRRSLLRCCGLLLRRSGIATRTLRSTPCALWLLYALVLIAVGLGVRFALLGAGGRVVVFFIVVVGGFVLGGLLVDLELGLVLYDVVSWAGHVDGWVAGLGVFFDGVAAFGLDGEVAFSFLFGDFA